ncbi:hypothetical protein BC938DRAFT_472827 [Jimgerdemannia flammicorona]|uniref:Uncharacterized protein n=1 Tax=Jimgerdemannia flammicorona TaxID=994334 RepID=A0A433QTN8_9FUNG|nr:hypothetical protein BC938DRAFT_472827 [Jimgerdemannia flammicorona]
MSTPQVIWFNVNLEGREPAKIQGIPLHDIADLREAIKNKKPTDITCDADALRLEITDPVGKNVVKLDEDEFDKHGAFENLISLYAIGKKNPILVHLPGKLLARLEERSVNSVRTPPAPGTLLACSSRRYFLVPTFLQVEVAFLFQLVGIRVLVQFHIIPKMVASKVMSSDEGQR